MVSNAAREGRGPGAEGGAHRRTPSRLSDGQRQVCGQMHGETDRGKGGASITWKERYVISGERLRMMVERKSSKREEEQKKEPPVSVEWLLLTEG